MNLPAFPSITPKSVFRFFTSIRLTVFCLLWLAVLTFVGTLYQVDNGIYLAQEKFFDSFFLWPFFPLPGAFLILILLFLNLCASFFVHYQAGWRMPGLMLIHLGLILLLLGGFVTRMMGLEANVSLFEGEGTNVASSVSEWEISSAEEMLAQREIRAVDFSDLRRGTRFRHEDKGPRFRVLELHRNARPLPPKELSPELRAALPMSPSGIQALQPVKNAIEPGENLPAIRLSVEGAKNAKEVILWGRDERPLALELEDGSVRFVSLRRKRFELPLFIELNDFQRTTYPGSQIPKDFRSLITAHFSNDVHRQVVIKMNEPFRVNGWTFYQQKFDVGPERELSVLQVTRNYGRLIPYWATGLTSLGLAMHFLQMQWMQLRRRRKSA